MKYYHINIKAGLYGEMIIKKDNTLQFTSGYLSIYRKINKDRWEIDQWNTLDICEFPKESILKEYNNLSEVFEDIPELILL